MQRILTTITLTALLLAAGCNKPRPYNTGRGDPFIPPQWAVSEPDLATDVLLGTPILSRDDAGILFVNAPLRSDIDKTIYVDYRATFLDRNGQVVYETNWSRKTLQANVPDQLSFNSLDARAADVRIAIRYAK